MIGRVWSVCLYAQSVKIDVGDGGDGCRDYDDSENPFPEFQKYNGQEEDDGYKDDFI